MANKRSFFVKTRVNSNTHSPSTTAPSEAINVVLFPIDFNDWERIIYFAGIVKGIASSVNIPIQGDDWNMNTQLTDNKFDDLVHFELITI
jgi:peptidoglycan LD-endopeptidase CwlK